MQQFTIRRKLFAFKADSWEGIKSHKDESDEANRHYEAYKKKYAKEIEPEIENIKQLKKSKKVL